MTQIIKSTRIILLILAGLLILYLIWQNFSPIGSQTIIFDLKDNKFISKLNPDARITEPECNESLCTQTIFGDPVYFDLLLARNFKSLNIELTYQSEESIDVRLGMQVKEGWNYMIKNKSSEVESNGSKTASYSFPLSSAWKNNRHINFLISIPELQSSDKKVIIRSLRFDLQR
ncbi:MAG: hypothetical protein UT02_C0023G0006 [Parcubacteria group bacterium GW2011_GWC2_38_7]|nr:MAG: hypothetical protein UT02_C0023G0006 [Parcubacteria group bacterium GW2011_GWC2_38_7]